MTVVSAGNGIPGNINDSKTLNRYHGGTQNVFNGFGVSPENYVVCVYIKDGGR